MFISGHPHYTQDGSACSVTCTQNRPLAVILVTLGQALVKLYYGDQIKKHEMDWAFDMNREKRNA
jgi:hypothetical protein